MKTKLVALVLLFCSVSVFAYDTAMDILVVNTGDVDLTVDGIYISLIPNGGGAQQYYKISSGGVVRANNQYEFVASGGLDWPPNTQPDGGPCQVSYMVDGVETYRYGGTDTWPSGTSTIQATGTININASPCTQDYTVTSVNPYTTNSSAMVVFSDGNTVGPYAQQAGGTAFNVDIYGEPCSLTWVVNWGAPQQVHLLTQDPNTNSALPNIVDTNAAPTTPLPDTLPDTNTIVPPTPNPSNSNLVWQAPGTGTATPQNIYDLGNGLNNGLQGVKQQDASDSSAIVQAINSAKAQAHSDDQGIKTSIDAGRLQNHSDLAGIANILQTNLPSQQNNTNLAQQSTLAGFSFQSNSNLTAIAQGVASNNPAALTQALNTNSQMLAMLSQSISNVTDLTNADFATEGTQKGMSNLLSLMFSNSLYGTNIAALTNYNQETTQVGVSNTLAGISNLLAGSTGGTNSETNYYGSLDSGTNAAAATASVTSMFSVTLGYLGDAVTALGTSPDLGGDPGAGSLFSLPFCGYIINLDPSTAFPGLADFSIGVFSFILVAGFLYFVGKQYVELVKTLGSTSTGGVPDLEVQGSVTVLGTGVTVGGNLLGWLVAIAVPALFLALWVTVAFLVVIPLTEFLGIYAGISTAIAAVKGTPSGVAGIHLLFAFFPVVLAVRILTARLLLYFTMAKAMLVAVAASRFLFGK